MCDWSSPADAQRLRLSTFSKLMIHTHTPLGRLSNRMMSQRTTICCQTTTCLLFLEKKKNNCSNNNYSSRKYTFETDSRHTHKDYIYNDCLLLPATCDCNCRLRCHRIRPHGHHDETIATLHATRSGEWFEEGIGRLVVTFGLYRWRNIVGWSELVEHWQIDQRIADRRGQGTIDRCIRPSF